MFVFCCIGLIHLYTRCAVLRQALVFLTGGEVLRLGLAVEHGVNHVVDRATLEGQRLLEEREQRDFMAEDHRAPV